MASSENRATLEGDGFSLVQATEANPPALQGSETEHQPLNQDYPGLVRGNYKVEDCTFKGARAVGRMGADLVKWLVEYLDGTNVVKKNFRFITWSEDGKRPIEIWEMFDCIPKSYKPDNATGTGTGLATFSFTIRPTRVKLVLKS